MPLNLSEGTLVSGHLCQQSRSDLPANIKSQRTGRLRRGRLSADTTFFFKYRSSLGHRGLLEDNGEQNFEISESYIVEGSRLRKKREGLGNSRD